MAKIFQTAAFALLSLLGSFFLAYTVAQNHQSVVTKLYDYATGIHTPKLDQFIPSAPIPTYSQSDITAAIQKIRRQLGLPSLIIDNPICDQGEYLIQRYQQANDLIQADLADFCPQCTQTGFLAIDGNYRLPGQTPWFETDEFTAFAAKDFTHACVYVDVNKVVIAGASLFTGAKTNPQSLFQTKSTPTTATQPIAYFTEDQLWQALIDYRHTHRKPDLQKVESLCRYARKRVSEHQQLMVDQPKEAYTNPDKYPLDAHAGFVRDGESGELFTITGFNVVAENLAYWPSAQYPHQVIEWGWDTSTEGHREAQLSTEYSHACLSGGEGFYVAIFARN